MRTPVRRVLAPLRLPLVLGLVDGLLNALTLASGSLIGSGPPISYSLALRVGLAALLTAAFSMFVADYAERRGHLTRASHQLNMTERGQLATTQLGRIALVRSLLATAGACGSSFAGATVPLLVGAAVPGLSWLVAVLAIAALAVLGALLGSLFASRPSLWAGAMAAGGVAVTWIGTWLHIA